MRDILVPKPRFDNLTLAGLSNIIDTQDADREFGERGAQFIARYTRFEVKLPEK